MYWNLVWVPPRSVFCPVFAKSVNNQTFMYKLYKWFVCLSLILGQKFWPNKRVATLTLIFLKDILNTVFEWTFNGKILKIEIGKYCDTVQSEDFVSSSRNYVFEMCCLSFHFHFITKLLRYYRTWENFGT